MFFGRSRRTCHMRRFFDDHSLLLPSCVVFLHAVAHGQKPTGPTHVPAHQARLSGDSNLRNFPTSLPSFPPKDHFFAIQKPRFAVLSRFDRRRSVMRPGRHTNLAQRRPTRCNEANNHARTQNVFDAHAPAFKGVQGAEAHRGLSLQLLAARTEGVRYGAEVGVPSPLLLLFCVPLFRVWFWDAVLE